MPGQARHYTIRIVKMDLIRAYACGLLPDFDMTERTAKHVSETEAMHREFIDNMPGNSRAQAFNFYDEMRRKSWKSNPTKTEIIMSARKLCEYLLEFYEAQEQTCEPSP